MTRAALLTLALLTLVPQTSQAYRRTATVDGGTTYLWWGQRDLSWALSVPDTGGEVAEGVGASAAQSVLQTSFGTWAAVDCTGSDGELYSIQFSFAYDGESSSIEVGYDPNSTDNQNLFIFRTAGLCSDPTVVPPTDSCQTAKTSDGTPDILACPNKYNCWTHDDDIYALTTTTFNTQNGELVDSDTEFNATTTLHRFTITPAGLPPCENPLDFSETGCIDVDLQNTATHEIGHYLGLAHTPVSSATMYATAALGETSKRELHSDDIAGVCDIYPVPYTPPSASGASSAGCASASATGLALCAIAVGLLRRRRT